MTTLARCCVCSFIILIYWSSTASAQLVDIPDSNLKQAIREALELSDEIPLTQVDMLRLGGLNAKGRQITDLTGLEHATNLTWLDLGSNDIQDLRPIAGLIQLDTLYIWGNPISDISPLENLTSLGTLHMQACQISDIRSLANLTGLINLHLYYNQIEDIIPLGNLTQLTELHLNNNRIVDVSPLANLENLMDLKLAGNPIRDFSPLLELNLKNLDIDIHMLQELAAVEVEIPDPNLERAIREKLALPDETPLTQADMLQLGNLDASNRQIKDLTGLESAIHLTVLYLSQNEIRDLTPLAGLSRLRVLSLWGNPISELSPLANLTELSELYLGSCQISDITPLAALTQLETLSLGWNQLIFDISPLRNLTQLTKLHLHRNRIMDVSPLANLTMLEELRIHNNAITDFSPLDGLSLTHFEYDEICELPRFPIQERVQNRNFPSIFNAWGIIVNRPALSREARLAHNDLYWSPGFGLHWLETEQGVQLVGSFNRARQQRDTMLSHNPNMLFIREIRMRDAFLNDFYHEDWPYWIRDATGNRVSATNYSAFLMDFTHPDVQEIIVQQAIAVAKCGLYDGIFLDWWKEGHSVLRVDWSKEGYRGNEAEQRARDVIIQRIRAGVGDGFLILVNPNRNKPRRAAPYINGLFMETLRDYDGGYRHDGLIEIESTLLWAEENLREPQVNCLEGWGLKTESHDSPTNRRWLRTFTAMSLTHSDGYVQYNDSTGHNHWYDVWEIDLGKPIGPTAQQYQNVEGLFIREFTNGWAVYNRSGVAQEVSLTQDTTGVASGQTGRKHQLADLDGEIYLRAGIRPTPTDINGDGVVNVLDLILTAQRFGGTAGDVNGDGTTNILDLILVAQHLR